MKTYDIIYLITGILGIYSKYKFANIFYKNNKTSKRKSFVLFFVFYILISIIYFTLDIPIMTLLANVVVLFIIGMIYEKNIKKALMMNLLVIGIIALVESIVVFSSNYVIAKDPVTSVANYHSIFGIIAINILVYLIVIFIEKVQNIKAGISIQTSYWIALITVPTTSFYFLIIILTRTNVEGLMLVIFIVLILILNIVIFTLYDTLTDYHLKREAEIVMNDLNSSYKRQLGIMKTSIRNIYSVQHDMNRHTNSLRTLIQSKNYEKLLEYVNKIDSEISNKMSFVDTGNVLIDSIINFEFGMNDISAINLDLNISQISENIGIADYDITVILSNTILNAIEAVTKLENDKTISIALEYDRGVLMYKITNNYDGALNRVKGNIITSKDDTAIHGIGLENVKRVIDKYNGEMNILTDNNLFILNIILFA